MPSLICGVKSCNYNNENCCCISSIDVSGERATESEATCCSSFCEKDGSFTNAAVVPNYEVDIKCKAENCVYNEDCICHASGVEIAGNRAECREETACATFCCEQ